MTAVESLPELNKVENGKAPKQRLSDPQKAKQLGWRMIYANRLRSIKNAKIQGAIDGNPPYPADKLRLNGEAWRSNVSFGEAAGSAAAAMVPFYDLFSGAMKYMRATTRYGKNADERSLFCDRISECADTTIREDWDDFDFSMQGMMYDRTIFGKGFHMRTDPLDFRYRWIPQHQVYAPDKSQASVEKIPFIMVRESYQVWELWEKIQDEGAAARVGWNVEAVKKAIERAYPKRTPYDATVQYEEIQRWIKDNQLWQGVVAETVNVFHWFVREYDGSISHSITDEGPQGGDTEPMHEFRNLLVSDEKKARDFMADSGQSWLYNAPSKYDRMSEVIMPFFFQTLQGSWNGANGLGQAIFNLIELKTRMLNSACDLSFIRSAITLQAKNEQALQKLNMIQFGTLNIIPPGFDVQQGQFLGDVTSPIAMNRQLDECLEMNTGVYRAKMQQPTGNPRTAEEVRMQFQQGAMLSTSAVNRFWLELDTYYFELFERMKKDKGFLKRIDDAGVPREALKEIECVYAYRTVGNGSPFMRREALNEMAPMVPMLPEKGRMAWLQDRVASMTNSYMVERYVPTIDEQLKTDDAAWAFMESVSLKEGQQPIITDTQNHIIHAQIHFAAATSALDSLQKGGSQPEVLQFLQTIGAHIAAHLAHLATDKTREEDCKLLEAQWKKLAQTTDQLKQVVQQQAKQQASEQAKQKQAMAKAQQIQGGQDPATMAAMAKAQNDIRIKQAKNQQLMQNKAQNEQLHAQLTAKQAQQNMAIADATAAAKIVRDHAAAKAKANEPKPKPKASK